MHSPTISDVEREAREAWAKARTAAFMLLRNSEGCAMNHYGGDHELFGMPGWLADCRSALEEADAIFTALSSPEHPNDHA